MMMGWLACPRCGGELAAADAGVACQSCGAAYGARDGMLDLVDPNQRVSSEGPGDTLAMAWRRRRWDELRGAEASENAAYLGAIWERLRPDDRVLDLACGPASFLGWMAEFAPDLAILGIDLSWDALEEARRVVGRHANVGLARASTRRRLPVKDDSCDVVLRRLAPALPEEIVRALSPGGYYLRFTFGPGHWREVYDEVPGLPRAREDTLVGEAERLRQLGLEVEEPIRESGREQFSLAAVLLAMRSNPAAFHAERLDLTPVRKLWHREDGGRNVRIDLSTEYAILVARKPGQPVPPPRRVEPKEAVAPTSATAAEHAPAEPALEAPVVAELASAEPAGAAAADVTVPEAAPVGAGAAGAVAVEPVVAETTAPEPAVAEAPSEEAAPAAEVAPKRRTTRRKAAEPAAESAGEAAAEPTEVSADEGTVEATAGPAAEPTAEVAEAAPKRTRARRVAEEPSAEDATVATEAPKHPRARRAAADSGEGAAPAEAATPAPKPRTRRAKAAAEEPPAVEGGEPNA
jgi:SAM-dependent methyltransferase